MRLSAFFKKFFSQRRDFIKQQYNRVLPLNELITDRWEKAKYLGFGEGTSVYDSCALFGEVKVGKNTWIGPFTVLDGSGGLEIGDNCSVSAGVQIYSHDSVDWALSGGKASYVYGKTIIGNNCYIGPNVVISMGITIENNVVIGANSFVNRHLEAGKKYAGNPVKEIG